jgi:hypothetical protein
VPIGGTDRSKQRLQIRPKALRRSIARHTARMGVQTRVNDSAVAGTPDRRSWLAKPAAALIVVLFAVALIGSYGVRQHWNLMPDYARGWHLGADLGAPSHQCSATAARLYPGLIDQSEGVGHSPEAWAYLAGCSDASHGYDDMRWQLAERQSGPRGMPED